MYELSGLLLTHIGTQSVSDDVVNSIAYTTAIYHMSSMVRQGKKSYASGERWIG